MLQYSEINTLLIRKILYKLLTDTLMGYSIPVFSRRFDQSLFNHHSTTSAYHCLPFRCIPVKGSEVYCWYQLPNDHRHMIDVGLNRPA